jgi:hypothetical protein
MKQIPLSAKMAVFDAYSAVFGRGTAFLLLMWRFLAATLFVLFCTASASAYLNEPRWLSLNHLAMLVFGGIFAVSWHRLVLLGDGRPWPSLRTAWRYALRLLLLLVVWYVLLMIGMAANFLESEWARAWLRGAMLLWTYLAARLMPLFPAAALDLKQSVWEAWRMTRGSGIRLWIGAVFVTMPFFMLLAVLENVSLGASSVTAATIVYAVVVIVFFLELGVLGAYASSVFRQSGAFRAVDAARNA